MVHLNDVKKENTLEDLVGDVSNLQLGPPGIKLEDSPFLSVYGSKYAAANDLPKQSMPEEEMPKEVAYKLIKSCTPY